MANYSKINNFTAKDSLASGDANKRVRGTEFDAEFNAISSAIATKPDSAGVTSVGGTGTASGLSLSGTVTSTGNLTLSGTVNGLAAGTYGIDISGNAATATTATNATNATTATNLAAGTYGIDISGNAATATSATSATTAGSVTGISMGSSTMTVSGSAPSTPIRAAVNMSVFAGVASFTQAVNVSSVTLVQTGFFQINYTTALPSGGVASVTGSTQNVNGTGTDAYIFSGGGTTTFGQVTAFDRGAATPSVQTLSVIGYNVVCP